MQDVFYIQEKKSILFKYNNRKTFRNTILYLRKLETKDHIHRPKRCVFEAPAITILHMLSLLHKSCHTV